MVIDETFMWLYAAFKVGRACIVLGVLGVLSTMLTFMLACETKEGNFKPTLICVAFSALCFFIAVLTPNFNEVKGYAVYRIGSDEENSDDAKRLFEESMKMIEGNGK